ncbi:4Fe-4S binding protein [bacterium]|nr:4Fe-4S binding protein [candidate division CSSED10-310 bacterium]
MPWIKQENCTGCGICIDECRVHAISMGNGFAHIDMELCIRCGTCHDVCPQDAVRHDSELIPIEVESNIDYTRKLLKNFQGEDERRQFLGRMIKHFNKEKIVAEKSIEKIQAMIAGE